MLHFSSGEILSTLTPPLSLTEQTRRQHRVVAKKKKPNCGNNKGRGVPMTKPHFTYKNKTTVMTRGAYQVATTTPPFFFKTIYHLHQSKGKL